MILVTGANGLLGSFICKSLYRRGHDFKGLVREESDLKLLQDIPPSHIIKGDLFDVWETAKILADVETVIHCAGLVSFHKQDKEQLFEVNVEATRNLVNTCLSLRVKKIIHISSVAALGRHKKNALVSESTKWESSKLNTVYAKSKYLGELEVWRASGEGLNVNIVNPSIILAPYQWERSSARLLKLVKGKFPFYPSGNINYVDLRDVTDAVIALYEANIKNERFILNAGSLSYKAFFEEVALRFKTSAPQIKLNPPLSWLGWALDNLKSLWTGKRALITRETVKLAATKSRYDNGKSHDILPNGYRPLGDTLDWACAKTVLKDSASFERDFNA